MADKYRRQYNAIQRRINVLCELMRSGRDCGEEIVALVHIQHVPLNELVKLGCSFTRDEHGMILEV
jgi:hypothetical protein